jgi:Trypsin-co-occurring domain 2
VKKVCRIISPRYQRTLEGIYHTVSGGHNMARIELGTYVEALRDELQRCIEMSEGKDLRFGTDKIDLEIEVTVETEVGGKGEVKFRFLVFDATLGGDAKGTVTNTQTIKMSLAPVYKGQTGRLMISSEEETKGNEKG